MQEMPSIEKINALLEEAHVGISASEIHGMICGYICAGKEVDGKMWFDTILGKKNLPADSTQLVRQFLLQLYEISNIKLHDEELNFQLLLPDDEVDLHLRAMALSHWCQGFIVALQQVGIWPALTDSKDNLMEDTKEAIENILGIGQLDYEHVEVNEEDEKAYMEVMEYVRIAVLMVYMDIANGRVGEKGIRQLH